MHHYSTIHTEYFQLDVLPKTNGQLGVSVTRQQLPANHFLATTSTNLMYGM